MRWIVHPALGRMALSIAQAAFSRQGWVGESGQPGFAVGEMVAVLLTEKRCNRLTHVPGIRFLAYRRRTRLEMGRS